MLSGKLKLVVAVFNALTLVSLLLCVATVVSWARAGFGGAGIVIGPVHANLPPLAFLILTAILPIGRVLLAVHDWRRARIAVWICPKCGADVPVKLDRCPCEDSPLKRPPDAPRQPDAGRTFVADRRAS